MIVNRSSFSREALFYESDEEFLGGIVSLVRKGLLAGESTLIAVGHNPARSSRLNVAVGGGRAWLLLCPYEAGALSDDVLDLPEAPANSKVLEFGRRELARTRELIACEADDARLSAARSTDLVAAVNELAANSILHGGGSGKLRVWRESDALVVEVRDKGRIEEPLAGLLQPAPTQEGGRGLWMVNQLCDLVQIRSGPEGTSARLRMGLS